ncbi:ParB-like dsDNA partitioning protein [Mycobacterium phage AnnaL29]|uniref:Arc-like repressor n=1 Tax=Mycobacterium phage AnnaL29 TaxID=1076630 RepID=UPI00024DEB1E|nr:Arc-like repressor [Mycobacterium phage AnnaL29]AGS82719.1 ParB-like dsDNA partitioning protein [Mycobacterium phage AnnaL29]
MSDAIERARQRAAEQKAAGVRPKKAHEIFARNADNMAKLNTYMPKDVIVGLKQRALDEETTVSKLLTELAQKMLAEPARPKEKKSYPSLDL